MMQKHLKIIEHIGVKIGQFSYKAVLISGLGIGALILFLITANTINQVNAITVMTVVLLVVALVTLQKINNTRAILIVATCIIAISIIVRLWSVRWLQLTPISDLEVTFNAALSWGNGPVATLHSFVFLHWGMYALLLRDVFLFVSPTVQNAQILNIFATVISLVSVAIIGLLSGKKRSVLGVLLLMAIYPTYLFYINFLSGELIFTALFSLAMLSLLLLQKYSKNRLYFSLFLISFIALIVASAQFKQMQVLLYPISIFCILCVIRLSKTDYIYRIAISFVAILTLPLLIAGIFENRLQYYAQGPVNHHVSSLFLASGLSTETQGQLNAKYVNQYLTPVKNAYEANKLNESVYKKQNAEMTKIALNEFKDFAALPALVQAKIESIWKSDQGVYFWFFTARTELVDKYQSSFVYIANGFFLTLFLLFVLNAARSLLKKEYNLVNLFCIAFICLYFVLSLLIEAQTRYRIILVPALAICAINGLPTLTRIYADLKKFTIGLSNR